MARLKIVFISIKETVSSRKIRYGSQNRWIVLLKILSRTVILATFRVLTHFDQSRPTNQLQTPHENRYNDETSPFERQQKVFNYM